MSSYIQVVSFIVSFFFGIVFYLLTRFNRFMLSNKNNVIKFLVTLVFIIDIVILYIYLMYKINFGVIHPYFVSLVVIGFILMSLLFEKCKDYVKKLKFFK